ncbi:MAG: hypothetical protein NTX22_02965 [Ignavibacteriales bacterium]|nr:hypothetical protein [Ignavibacteriales bacterium]
MKKYLMLFIIFLLSSFIDLKAQEEASNSDSLEIFLIDSYVTPETPNRFILSFITSRRCQSKVMLQNKYEFKISENFSEDHKTSIDISALKFDSSFIPFVIIVKDSLGNEIQSEKYDVSLGNEQKQEVVEKSNYLFMCCLGGVIFGFPSPTLVVQKDKQYFSLTKEIPIFSIRAFNSRYPIGYFAVEYSYIFNAETRNYFRAGYKHVFEIPYLEYISPGINWFTNFKGFNGISPEISIGLVKFYDVFTVYTKYRYNLKPNDKSRDFHEITVGLYSSFFSLNLNF